MRRRLPFLPFLSSILLIMAFPGWGLWPLVLVGLVPLQLHCRDRAPVSAFFAGWGCGALWFAGSLHWITHTLSRYGSVPFPLDQLVIGLLAALLGLSVGLYAVVVSRSDSFGPWHLALLLPSAWLLLEIGRSWVPAPFPWLYLGSALWDSGPLRMLFPLAGVWGASFIVVAVNTVVAGLIRAVAESQFTRAGLLALAAVSILIVPVTASYLLNVPGEQGPPTRVAVVQGNFEQQLKWDESIRDTTVRTYLDLSKQAAREGASIILWPETAMPFYFGTEPELEDRIVRLVRRYGIHLVFGSPGYDVGERTILLYNRAYHMFPDGSVEHYDKNRLVPFGEYIPFKTILSFVDRMVPGEGEFHRGRWRGPFSTPVPAGTLICFEIAFPDMSRRMVADGAGMLLNITNDGWFGRSWGPSQHMALAAVRAAENGVPVLRAANTGISAIFGPDGNILARIPLFKRGMIVVDVPAGKPTFYNRAGDWILPVVMAVITFTIYRIFYIWRDGRWTGWKNSETA